MKTHGRDGWNHALNRRQYNFIGVGELTMYFPQELGLRIADISSVGIEALACACNSSTSTFNLNHKP